MIRIITDVHDAYELTEFMSDNTLVLCVRRVLTDRAVQNWNNLVLVGVVRKLLRDVTFQHHVYSRVRQVVELCIVCMKKNINENTVSAILALLFNEKNGCVYLHISCRT